MKRFAALYARLDSTTKTNEKIDAMADYFAQATAADAAWAVYFLSGRRPKRLVQSSLLRLWAAELTGIPVWLVEESYGAVGDSAEAAALLLPPPTQQSELPLHVWIEERVLQLRGLDVEEQQRQVTEWWRRLDKVERLVLNKLLTGSFRVGVSQRLLTRAVAQYSGIEAAAIAHRLMGSWEPTPEFFAELLAEETSDSDSSRPYPFYLAYALEDQPQTLGPIADWQIEWKWDGIRAQLIRREGQTYIWSRGEELVTERYPEVAAAAAHLPDGTVIDGELLPWKAGRVLPFAQLQRRIGRKTLGAKLLQQVPVILLAYDLLEWQGQDQRPRGVEQRRSVLAELIAAAEQQALQLSPLVAAHDWQTLEALREESRSRDVEGFMLKRIGSVYKVGRKRGDWWKWKVDPYTIDAVLIYAQRGSGRRASLYSDYTFAVWDGDQLVPFAKAYSGLTDAEIRKLDNWIRRNTKERFGPVRSVTPQHVFELAFENIQKSKRHKSGIAVRFPRILRWRHDKPIAEADTLETIKGLLNQRRPPTPSG